MEFVQEIKCGRKWHEDGRVALTTPLEEFVTFEYHFFNNTFNTFILLLPAAVSGQIPDGYYSALNEALQ